MKMIMKTIATTKRILKGGQPQKLFKLNPVQCYLKKGKQRGDPAVMPGEKGWLEQMIPSNGCGGHRSETVKNRIPGELLFGLVRHQRQLGEVGTCKDLGQANIL